MGPTVQIVLPVFNEIHILRRSVEAVLTFVTELQPRWQTKVLIVSNGSTDGTDVCALDLAAQYPTVSAIVLAQAGRGGALRTAWKKSDADFSIYMDIDLSTDLEAVPSALEALQAGADLVVGSRLHPCSKTKRSFKRELLSRGYNLLFRWLVSSRYVVDTQCGFKGIRLRTVRPMLPAVVDNNWFFDTELLVVCERAGLQIESIPVTWTEDPDSRVKIWSTISEEFRGLLRVCRSRRPATCP